MKAQQNYTTTVTTRAWLWRGAAALAALLALAAVIFGLMGLSDNGRSPTAFRLTGR